MAKNTLPEFAPPMMANSADKPFDSPDFIFEIKLDGYRAITVFDAAGKPHLWSRSGLHKNGSPLFRLSVPLVASYDSISDNIRRLFPVVGYFKMLSTVGFNEGEKESLSGLECPKQRQPYCCCQRNEVRGA